MAPQLQRDPLEGNQKYQKIQSLSSGAFGFVHLYRNNLTGEPTAIKFLERGEEVTRYVESEVLNHRILRHPHVIEFKEVFLTPEFICIAMEYASGGNLFSYVKQAIRLKEAAARWFFQQLIIGLDYCHRMGVVNRDIKLENTLLQKVTGLPLPLLKVCDFGYSKSQSLSAPKSKVGTMAYMAPEVISNAGRYDGKLADIWSCGVMLYVMLFGRYPFDAPPQPTPSGQGAAANPQDLRAKYMTPLILAAKWAPPPDVPVTPPCLDLLNHLLVADPVKRLTMAQIQSHPWFLANLPKDALAMNDDCLANTDYSGVQTVEDIKQIMLTAQSTPNRFTFNNTDDHDQDYQDMMIDATIREEADGMSEDWRAAPPKHPAGGDAAALGNRQQGVTGVAIIGRQQQVPAPTKQ
ncbi:hypothetical protein CEUSTIGMA_g132.t1 [Chlamydomonas eustigma]|uniref:Protein kinase domain-containing protein n=1 Tax=Chlamydomonas eustigma TaxID=1157962 RepID=A0A250WPQ3_9CHLO|nr:hypothetical protein CEUSTIGMA_g132.t1 [Chlamydomonas eustigma]|eukprot:GAX72676.1 hypothetical protein CEUSTIGMA_g132.t1 [Chlamydomonas eustigma]